MLYIYIATFLLIIGIFCFIYASFSVNKRKHKVQGYRKKKYSDSKHYRQVIPQLSKYDNKIIKNRKFEELSEDYIYSDNYIKNSDTPEIKGSLYLDYLKKIPYEVKDIQKMELTEDMFRMLRRVGHSSIKKHTNGFTISALNSHYNYNFLDIGSILFYKEGFILCPNKKNYPIAIFLTKNVDEFKDYLK